MSDAEQSADLPHVVVVGAGFAGLSAVRALGALPVRVTLVDRNGYNTFQPLLYQVATGGLNPGDVTYPVRSYTARRSYAQPRRATVLGVDADTRRVRLDDGEVLDYDYLIVATGVTTNYFGIPGASEHALAMYTRDEALAVRDRIFDTLEEKAEQPHESRSFTVVVVGGGATGVEMAGALAELRNTTVAHAYPELGDGTVNVVLIEQMDHLLAPFKPRQQDYALRALTERGVDLRLGTAVREVRADAVVVGDGEEIAADLVVWATGVSAPAAVREWGLPAGRGGRIVVDADLRVPDCPQIFAVGDIADVREHPVPQLAQPAIQAGAHAAEQIGRLLDGRSTMPFEYRDKGIMATIGRRSAVAEIAHGPNLRGTLAWLAWLGLHIVTLLGNRNRAVTLLNLGWRYVRWPRNTNVIIGR
jgi:NADH dehydrogenase